MDSKLGHYPHLKRLLTLSEVEEVQAMARRLTALCLLQPQLDANYTAVKNATWQLQSQALEGTES